MQGVRAGKQPYYYRQLSLSSDSVADEHPEHAPQTMTPDLFAYFSEFPDLSPPQRVKIARTYASALCAQLGIGGRKRRKATTPPGTPPTVPEDVEHPSE